MRSDQQKTILLVEDDMLTAKTGRKFLEKDGYRIVLASTGIEAVDAIQNDRSIDLVLMDIELGSEMDGVEAAERILAMRELPVVFLSNHTDPEIVQKTERVTSYGYVVKNTGSAVLDASIRMAFRLFDAKMKEKTQQEALRKNEALLSNALKIGNLGHWEFDVASGVFTFTDNFYTIFHTTAEERGGYQMSAADYAARFVHPADALLVEEEIRRALETSDPHFSRYLEHRMIYADGTMGYIAVRFFIVKDSSGKTVKTYGVNQDITDRVKTYEAMVKNEERFRSIVEGISDGFFILEGSELSVAYFNHAAEEMLGRKHDDVLGKPLFDTFPEARGSIFEEKYRHAFDRKEFILFETYFGMEPYRNWYDVRVYPGKDNVSVFFQISTERKRGENALRESEEKFRSLVDNIDVGVALHEIITGENSVPVDFVWLDCNPMYETLTGLKCSEIVGRRGTEIIPNLERKWIDAYGKVAQTGEPVMIVDHSDYLNKFWEVRAYSPQKNHFAVAMTDVTERRKAEEELRNKMAELERFNKIMVGRENRMVELKKEVNDLCRASGLPDRYSAPAAILST